jgi:hypothetical protein
MKKSSKKFKKLISKTSNQSEELSENFSVSSSGFSVPRLDRPVNLNQVIYAYYSILYIS